MLKSNKGITLTSLIIYIIVLSVVIGIISGVTKYFYANTEDTIIKSDTAEQYERLITYMTDDINSRKNKYS